MTTRKPTKNTLKKVRNALLEEIEGARLSTIIRKTGLDKETVRNALKYLKKCLGEKELWQSKEDRRWHIEDKGMAQQDIIVQSSGDKSWTGMNLRYTNSYNERYDLSITATAGVHEECADQQNKEGREELFRTEIAPGIAEYAKIGDQEEGVMIIRWRREGKKEG
ncbi:hypothetical protein DRP07_02470 [Archaeoglobales archaeon]|nr:MAG: hypothetical protein DRP07_02470 [Archaeoglobales archaeon]